jgi:hypothetical protein
VHGSPDLDDRAVEHATAEVPLKACDGILNQ